MNSNIKTGLSSAELNQLLVNYAYYVSSTGICSTELAFLIGLIPLHKRKNAPLSKLQLCLAYQLFVLEAYCMVNSTPPLFSFNFPLQIPLLDFLYQLRSKETPSLLWGKLILFFIAFIQFNFRKLLRFAFCWNNTVFMCSVVRTLRFCVVSYRYTLLFTFYGLTPNGTAQIHNSCKGEGESKNKCITTWILLH